MKLQVCRASFIGGDIQTRFPQNTSQIYYTELYKLIYSEGRLEINSFQNDGNYY